MLKYPTDVRAEHDLAIADIDHAYYADHQLTLARHPDSRRCFLLLSEIVEEPGLAERLIAALMPAKPAPQARKKEKRS